MRASWALNARTPPRAPKPTRATPTKGWGWTSWHALGRLEGNPRAETGLIQVADCPERPGFWAWRWLRLWSRWAEPVQGLTRVVLCALAFYDA